MLHRKTNPPTSLGTSGPWWRPSTTGGLRRWFDAGERLTAAGWDRLLRAPRVLEPTAAALMATMRLKTLADRAIAAAWTPPGSPSPQQWLQTLHAINCLESRIADLEEQLEDAAASAAP